MVGDDRILYFKISDVWTPVSCVVSDAFSEFSEIIETTTRDNASYKTVRPIRQSYSISFDGLVLDSGTLNLQALKTLKRSRTKIEWKMDDGVNDYTFGSGYLVELSDVASLNEFVSFSAVLQGVLSPEIYGDSVYEIDVFESEVYE